MYSRQDLVDLMPTYPRAHSSIVEALDSDSVECIPSDKDLLYTQTHFDFDSLLLKTNAYRAVRRRRPQRQATRSRKADVGTQAKEGDLIDLSSIVEIQATPVHRLSKDLECLTFGGEQLLTGLSMKDRKTSEDLVSFLDYPQQPALDTETLATLVRSAAEMRNAFDYIKRDITESESGIVAYVDKKSSLSNHRSCTIPSPQFTFGSPEAQVPSQMSLKAGGQESLATRKNNMSRRMLKVLDDKDTDLQRIEDMLMRAPSEAQSLEGAGEFNQSPTRVRLQIFQRAAEKAPPLPALTEIDPLSINTELAIDVSRLQDEKKSHFSLPDHGLPVAIRTHIPKTNGSSTSLSIEYFESGSGPNCFRGGSSTRRKPSVRVHLTPSKRRRRKIDYIQVVEPTKSSRKTSGSERSSYQIERHLDSAHHRRELASKAECPSAEDEDRDQFAVQPIPISSGADTFELRDVSNDTGGTDGADYIRRKKKTTAPEAAANLSPDSERYQPLCSPKFELRSGRNDDTSTGVHNRHIIRNTEFPVRRVHFDTSSPRETPDRRWLTRARRDRMWIHSSPR
ncbi:hypothetical protein SCARD494_01936 [Seiridium cardinale]